MDLFLQGAATLVSSWTSIGIFFAGLIGGLLFGAIPGISMLTLAAIFLPFSVYLTAVELFVIHAICRWCVVSAVLTIGIFLLVAPWRFLRRSPPESFEGLSVE